MIVRVQHHPSRSAALERLLASLGTEAEVIPDPRPEGPPAAWRTYRAALETPTRDSHVLIVQDDAVAAPDWRPRAKALLREYPGALVAFFHPSHPPATVAAMRRAAAEGRNAIPCANYRWVPTVALVWPTALIEPFLTWIDEWKQPRPDFPADDPLVGEWRTKHRIPGYLAVPCLFDHPDDVPSILKSSTRPGPSRTRMAAVPSPLPATG